MGARHSVQIGVKMNKFLKGCFTILAVGAILIGILVGSLVYAMKYKITETGSEKSPDGSYEVIFQQRGEPEFPFGATHVRFLVKSADGSLITKENHTIYDDGASFRPANWEVRWYPAGVEIILKGSEQEDSSYIVYYDKNSTFQGYTEEQALTVMRKRYGEEISFLGQEGGDFCFNTGEFTFQAANDFRLTDNYEEQYFSHMAEEFSANHNRHVMFETEGEGAAKQYVPIISFNGRQAMEQESFCNAVCDLVEYFQQDSFVAAKGITLSEIRYYVDNRLLIFSFSGYLEPYDRIKLYNALYAHLEQGSLEVYEHENGSQSVGNDNDTNNAGEEALSPEIWEYYLSIEPSCSYPMKDGMEYKMIGVDRAAGSSYFVLISTSEDGSEYSLVNKDPYLGHGGEAKWLTFLENEKIGFSCLAYSGGAYGRLYRTEDGGKTFTQVEYPSPQIKLPDGTLYNPFVMPEEVYEQDGKLYLAAGQGPDGDYYGEEGFCSGLYESGDNGITWKYLGEQPVGSRD